LSTGDRNNIPDVQMWYLDDILPVTYTTVLIFPTSSRNILSDKFNNLLQSRLTLMIHSHSVTQISYLL